MNRSLNFQLGLLHFAHLLMSSDGRIDEQEKAMLERIRNEEEIPHTLYTYFLNVASRLSELQSYRTGVERLNQCNEEEKLSAFVHLYRLAQADDRMDMKEVRFLLYSLKQTKIDFEDVVLSARLSSMDFVNESQKRVA
ncbi:MAG: hypothetical protein L6Q51_10620 [Cyclobacteriaceae bacterium]|nr:hypothetical protein [Cyclobacteriaceae bacterium]